ncbi:bestrophin, RFP-TM, chloride channel [Nitzschia inconspicua]|uniref:Bestrophin, RFP-TM, chloride channel n=1 Tax=Nitzschia inconspicua TaxID=303405 RepID=A0A9K3PCP1_9STRA|nr:bestrophin, RFP-TM, chloride channel [Nitzschia inconspicua]
MIGDPDQSFSLNQLAESVYTSLPGVSEGDEFPLGCQFSPDGYCVLTAKRNQLQLYNTPLCKHERTAAWDPVLTYDTGDAVRSYSWYPRMKSSDAASCCFVGVSRDSPIHLYDAYTQQIRATYCPHNAMDELESPSTVCFVEDGQQLVTGGFKTDRMLHVFDISRPGRQSSSVLKMGKTRRSKDGQKGLVSALAYSQDKGVLAVGTYSPGSIYLYDLRMYANAPAAEVIMSGNCLSGHGKSRPRGKRKRILDDAADLDCYEEDDTADTSVDFSAAKRQWFQSRTRSGVTQLEFDSASDFLFSCSRKSKAVIQWDLRKLSSCNFCPGIASYEMENDTNQVVEFQLYENQIWMGGMDKCVRTYDQLSGKLLSKLGGFRDAVNGVSVATNATSSGTMLAVSTGTRHFSVEDNDAAGSDGAHGDGDDDTPRYGSLEVHSVSTTTRDSQQSTANVSCAQRDHKIFPRIQHYSILSIAVFLLLSSSSHNAASGFIPNRSFANGVKRRFISFHEDNDSLRIPSVEADFHLPFTTSSTTGSSGFLPLPPTSMEQWNNEILKSPNTSYHDGDSLERFREDVRKVLANSKISEEDPALPSLYLSHSPSFTMIWGDQEWNMHTSRWRYVRYMLQFPTSRLLRRCLPQMIVLFLWTCLMIPMSSKELLFARMHIGLTPMSLVSTFVAALLTMRSNQGLSRLNEARKAFAICVQHTRELGQLISVSVLPYDAQMGLLAARHNAAFCWNLNAHVLGTCSNEITGTLLPNPVDAQFVSRYQRKPPAAIIVRLRQIMEYLIKRNKVEKEVQKQIFQTISKLNEALTIAERIRNSPVPPLYTAHTTRLLIFYLFWLPLALHGTIQNGIATLVVTMAVGYAMLGLDELSHLCELPFKFMPLTQLSKMSMVDAADAVTYQPPPLDPSAGPVSSCNQITSSATSALPHFWI